MNATEKMHRIQLAANAWYAAALHWMQQRWERVRRE